MKKHLEYRIASALAVSALAIPNAIYAQPVMEVVYAGPEIVINTPEDFINTFCSVRVLNEFNEEVCVLIMEVNPDNYGIVLSGKPFYDDYCINNPDMANAINAILIESPAHRSYEDYFNDAMAVQTMLEEQAAAQAQAEMEQAALQAEMEQAALQAETEPEVVLEMAPVEEIVPEIPAEEPVVEPEPVTEEIVEEVEPVVLLAAAYPTADLQPVIEVTAEPLSVSESPLLTMLAEAEPVKTETVEEVALQVNDAPVLEQETVEEVQAPVEEVVPVPVMELAEPTVVTVEESVEAEPVALAKMETETGGTQESSAAQSFVDRYLKDETGNIYAAATPSNYTRIIGSLKEWNNLPISVQNEVNTILMSATGVSYQALLQQAQQIASGAINRVNTGVDTQAGLFGLLAGISAAAAGLFYRKQRGR